MAMRKGADESVAIDGFPAWGKNDAGTAWAWGYNDWNVAGVGASPTAGGQVDIIRVWTRWSDNQSVTGNVAYGWGCWDSPGDFNAELMSQSGIISNCRRNVLGDGTPNPAFKPGLLHGTTWFDGQTTAPGGLWGNYVFPGRRLSQNGLYHYKGTMTQAQLDTIEQHAFYINGALASVPGLSTMCRWGSANRYSLIIDKVVVEVSDSWERTSGTDCSGLAHKVATYSGSSYYIRDKSKWNTDAFATNDSGSFQIHPGTWRLEGDNIPQDVKDRDRLTASLAVPGDLLVVGGSHVVIVQDLEYPVGSEVITAYNQVRVIHSTSGGEDNPVWRVQKDVWGDVYDTLDYQLRRYR